MRNVVLFLFAVILVAGLAACSTEDTPTAVAPAPSETPVVAQDAPAQSGMYVIRSLWYYAVWFADAETNTGVILGADALEYCNGIVDFDIVPVQDVINPQDQLIINELIRASDVRATVWPFTTFDCGLFQTNQPLASGTVDMVTTDNNYYAYLEENTGERVNTFGTMARGKLVTPDGDWANFRLTYRYVWDPLEAIMVDNTTISLIVK